jgi:hypothetical protein
VDSLVHEILGASSAGDSYSFIAEWTGLGQGEKSAVFLENSDSKSEWMNLFQRFGDSVDIIRVQWPSRDGRQNGARNRPRQSGQTGTNPTDRQRKQKGRPPHGTAQ